METPVNHVTPFSRARSTSLLRRSAHDDRCAEIRNQKSEIINSLLPSVSAFPPPAVLFGCRGEISRLAPCAVRVLAGGLQHPGDAARSLRADQGDRSAHKRSDSRRTVAEVEPSPAHRGTASERSASASAGSGG